MPDSVRGERHGARRRGLKKVLPAFQEAAQPRSTERTLGDWEHALCSGKDLKHGERVIESKRALPALADHLSLKLYERKQSDVYLW